MPDPMSMAEAAFLAAVIAWLIARFGRAAGGLGVGLGILVGAWVLGLAPRVPPREALDRVLLVLIPAAVLAEVAAAAGPKWAGWASRMVVAAVAAPVLVHGSSYVTDLSGPGSREWTPGLTTAIFASLSLVLFLVWAGLTALASRAGQSASGAVAVAAGGAAVAVMLSGYATGGQLGLPLAAAIGVFALISGLHQPGAVGVAVVGLFSLLAIARLFAGLTTQNALVLLMAPLLAWGPELPRARQLGPRLRGGLRVALTAIPVIVTLWLAQQKFAADSTGPAAGSGEPSLSDYLDFGK
ncbi:MAG TPA: hypothetical protein VGP68_17295 [Gemmataceae bacterium]|nr:hypothetical protein [Gemmataceae bacterium]